MKTNAYIWVVERKTILGDWVPCRLTNPLHGPIQSREDARFICAVLGKPRSFRVSKYTRTGKG